MMFKDKDEKKALSEAEDALRHMEDMSKQIDARESVVHKQMAPFKLRLARNHFLQEYEELFRGNR
jgi:hypothetical protein